MPTGPGALLAEVADGDATSLMASVRDALRSWIGAGPVFLASADPVNGSFAGAFTFDIPDDAAAAFLAIETAGRDVVTFRGLASGAAPVQSLFTATHAEPRASARWREVIEPLGWGDELRAAVRAHGSTWGYLCMHRDGVDRPFGPRDVDRLSAMLPAIAAALRRVALCAPDQPAELPSGVILVDRAGRVAGMTGGAAAWLHEIGPRRGDGLPLLLSGLAATVMESGRPATSTLSTRTGRSALVEAAPLLGSDEAQVAVLVSAAPATDRLTRFALACGLTAREQEIVGCVLDGMSTREISDVLGISPHTVQAHLTSVFGKTGLRSRGAIVGRLARR